MDTNFKYRGACTSLQLAEQEQLCAPHAREAGGAEDAEDCTEGSQLRSAFGPSEWSGSGLTFPLFPLLPRKSEALMAPELLLTITTAATTTTERVSTGLRHSAVCFTRFGSFLTTHRPDENSEAQRG